MPQKEMDKETLISVLKDRRFHIDIEYQVPTVFKYEIKSRDARAVEYAKTHGILLTMDNGGKTFLVTMHSTFLRIYAKHIRDHWDSSSLLEYGRPLSNTRDLVLMSQIALEESDIVFVGTGSYNNDVLFDEFFVGNSILVAKENCKNTIISSSLEVFQTSEPIVDFKSTVCNSLVSYGFAKTKSFLVSIGPIGCYGYFEQPLECVQDDDTAYMICNSNLWMKRTIDNLVLLPRF